MKLGFAEPGPTDYHFLTTPQSSQVVSFVFNRIEWSGVTNGPLDTGWIAKCAPYGHLSLLIPVLVGPQSGTPLTNSGSGQTTSPLDPTGAANPTLMTLADVTAGVWDTLYAEMFAIIAGAYPTATLRIGNEWYGQGWYPWNGSALGAAGKAAYQHLVTLARTINSTWTYEWMGCLDLSRANGYSFADVQSFYPGDSYVDYLSGDIYDCPQIGVAGQASWDIRAGQLAQCVSFAQAHGKPYNITEFGLQNIAQTGIGNDDDPDFLQAAYHWGREHENSLGWMMYFQNPPGVHADSWDGCLQNNPQSEAMFKALFGSWARQLAGETTHRFVTPDFGPIGAVKAIGSFVHARANGLKTLAVTPQTVGNVLVLSILSLGNAATVSAVTGGGVTTWTKAAGANPAFPAGTTGDSELWYGVVTTPGAATITITLAQTGVTILGCQEFSVGTPATWALDTSAASVSTSAEASGNYPPVTPSGPNRLYVGTAQFIGGVVGGATSGFTYKSGGGTYETNAQFVYNTVASNPTVQSPEWTQTSGFWSAVSGLLVGTPVDPTAGSHRLRLA